MGEKPIGRRVALGVIENMSWFTGDDGRRYEIFGSGGGQLLADRLDVPLVGRVPLVIQLREGGDTGNPIQAAQPLRDLDILQDEQSQRCASGCANANEFMPSAREIRRLKSQTGQG